MTSSLASTVTVRDAEASDNHALLQLAATCPMQGDIGLCVDRAPNFFALNRLQGEPWRVGIAQSTSDEAMGCIGGALRRAYIGGRATTIGYAADLKVAPRFRGSGAADELTHWVAGLLDAFGGPDLPILLTILAGNKRMERRAPGPRGLPRLERIATIRSFSIPLLFPRSSTLTPSLRVQPARAEDIPEMMTLWSRVARDRQFAPVLDQDSFALWLDRTNLRIGDYRVARDAHGNIAGFLALWDQHRIKQLRVTEYSTRLAAVRFAFNALAPLVGSRALPAPGAPLTCITGAHVCVPARRPDLLHALIGSAYRELRGSFSVLNLGLDTRDPLCSALKGFMAQPTVVHAYMTTPRGGQNVPPLDARPVHYEIALV